MGHRSAELSELLAFRIWAAISLFMSRGICWRSLSPRLRLRLSSASAHGLTLRLLSLHKFYMSGLYGTIGSREREPNIAMHFLGLHARQSCPRKSTFMTKQPCT